MKNKSIKLLSLVVAILIIISSLPILASAAQPTSYSQSSNSGTRNEVCTTLAGTSAASYYTGSYAYDRLFSLSSSTLKSSLHELMTNTHKKITTYNDCRDYVWQTDCEKNNTSKATTLYTSHSMGSSEWAGTWSCNREHVWPQSLGGGNTSGGGADLHHIRPAEAGVNSSRGNKVFGYASGQYVPQDNVKGDVARICLYVYVRWGSAWGADSITEVFQSVDVLLEWCELDPVDTWEMGRNEVVQSIQGNRNVFIDYPEFAWLLYGREVPEGMVTPSGSALNGEVPTPPVGGGDEGGTTPNNPVVPDVPAEIPASFVLQNGGKYVTDIASTYTSSSGSTKKQLKISADKSEAAVMSLVENSDGTVSFKCGDKYLLADGTHVELVTTQSDNTKFVIETASGGYFVKCANATYNGNAQYLEVYKENLTCYGMGSDTSIYTFVFESADSTTPDDPNNPGNEDVTNPDDPNQDDPKPDDPNQGNTPSDKNGMVAEFDFGANGEAAHTDGTEATGSKSYTSGDYTLTLTDLNKIYVDATDAKGNSCLKVGTSTKTGSLSFTVGEDIDKVVLYIAMYKAKTTKLSINGTDYEIKTSSNDGEYTEITVDTSENKTVTLVTVGSTTGRCMINTIEFWCTASTPDIDPPETDSESETDSEEIESDSEKTESTEKGEIESTEKDPSDSKPGDNKPGNDDQNTQSPSILGGCGSSVTGGVVFITVLCIGVLTATRKKKED